MKTRAYKTGFTLIEMIVVIAIIAILISMVFTIAKRIDDQSKERLTRETIALLGNALEQFRDFGYEYKDANYAGLVFPLDCNGYYLTSTYPYPNLLNTLQYALYSAPQPTITISGWAQHDPNFSGSEALYFILRQIPDCRATLDKIDKSLLTNIGTDHVTPITITIGASPALPFTRIIDPWGTPLRYDYYPEFSDYILVNPGGNWPNYVTYRNSAKKSFPVITSAGPDKQFDTADDISNVN